MTTAEKVASRSSSRVSKRRKPAVTGFELIHPGKINIINQVRPYYDTSTIAALADSLAALGQIEPPIIAELKCDEVTAYVAWFNDKLGGHVNIADLVVDVTTGCIYIVISGHQRIKASMMVLEHGCPSCQSHYGCKAVRKCREHSELNPGGVIVQVRRGIHPHKAFQLQMAENTKKDVPRDADAAALRIDWTVSKSLDPRLTMADFARRTNRSPSYISDALRFCQLPEPVKQAYQGNHIAFTSAVELSRLQAAGVDEAAILYSLQLIVAKRMTTVRVARYVSGVLEARRDQGELSLFVDDGDSGRTSTLAHVVARTAHMAFTAEGEALGATLQAMRDGVLPVSDPLASEHVRKSLERGTNLRIRLGVTS